MSLRPLRFVALTLAGVATVAGCGAAVRPAASVTGHVAATLAAAPPVPPVPPVQPEPCPPPPRSLPPPPPPLGPPRVAEAAVPVVSPPPPRRVSLRALSGKGLWLTVWPGQRLDVAGVLAAARAAGVRQLWLRTGGSIQGFYGTPLLAALLARAHAAGIAVIAWDFPSLSDPAADARRAAAALAHGADGFAADIEQPTDGTYTTVRRVAYYLSLVRRAAGARPVVAVVPRPTAANLASYPYRTEALYADAFAPMVYWSCAEPGQAVADAVRRLAGLRPVAPIGQAYDMGPEGGRPGLPTAAEIRRFLDVARRTGAIGASLYDLETASPAELTALAAARW